MEEQKSLVSLSEKEGQKKFRTLYLNNGNIAETLSILGIPTGTYDNYFYENKYGLRHFVNDIKAERFIAMTEKVSKNIMSMNTDEISDKRIAIQQKEAEFLRETLGKDRYSKRIETIGFNLNKSEPLDSEQKEKLDKLFSVKNVEYTEAEGK